jgi:uroporphyrinogen decarboxylase
VGDKVALQGNLDPAVLFGSPEASPPRRKVLDAFGRRRPCLQPRPRHLLFTPPENVSVLVNTV